MSEHTTGTTPPQESNPEWCIIAESVLGATHKRTGKPNQDAQASHPSADAVILALADGHGSEKYFRSHKGAKFAVATAVEQMRSFLTETAVQPNIASIERQATKLPRSIVERWVERVLADFQNTRFESEEEQKRYNKLRAEAGQQKELVPYGSTLLAIVVTQRFTFCLQLGDGDITFIKPHGEIVPAMAEDKRLLANETTSLCTPTAAEDFRLRFYPRKSTPPALVMLSTDGYVNSFSTQAGFHQVGVDILKQLYQDNGLEKVQAQLKGWLEEATRSGSGDDITVGFLCHLPTIRTRPAPIIKPPALADPPVVPTVPQPSPAGPMIKDNISSADAGNKQAAVTAAASPQFKKSHTPGPHPPRIEPSTKQPSEVIVSRSEPGHCRTITEALKLVAQNGSIRVQPGTYQESLRIEKSISLIADGDVRIESTVPSIEVLAPNVVVKGFTVTGHAQGEKMKSPTVVIAEGKCQMMQCTISTHSSFGLFVIGKAIHVKIMGCRISSTGGYGIVVHGDETPQQATECEMADTRTTAIQLKGDCLMKLERCELQPAKIDIVMGNGTIIPINEDAITGNKKTNIRVGPGFNLNKYEVR